MADLTPDEIQYENARLTREQWAAEANGESVPTSLPTDTEQFPTADTAAEIVAPGA